MRILVAGATGAIGRPLVRCSKENGRVVFALTRSPQSSRAVGELGAEPVAADALDAASVQGSYRAGSTGCNHQRVNLASPALHGGGSRASDRHRSNGGWSSGSARPATRPTTRPFHGRAIGSISMSEP